MKTAMQRKIEIMMFLYDVVKARVTEIGQGIGLVRSPYLLRLIAELVRDDALFEKTEMHPKWGKVKYYSLNREHPYVTGEVDSETL